MRVGGLWTQTKHLVTWLYANVWRERFGFSAAGVAKARCRSQCGGREAGWCSRGPGSRGRSA
jgi:hypothetical protein